jgi:hypothetical protein
MYAAWNRGDVDGVIERSGRVSNRNTVLIAILGGGARIVADCAVTGIGPSAHGGRGVVVSIACAELITDNFYTPAGIIHENTVTWEVNADGMRTWTGANMDVTLVRGDAWAFLLDFDEWLYHQESLDVNGWIWSHPEYGLPNNIGAPCCPYSTETWSSVRQAVALVPEFLAIPDDEWELIERPGTETCGARWEYLTTTIANQLPEPAGEIHRLLTDISHQVTRPDPVSTQILGETAALLDQVIGEALADSDSHPVELIEILQGIEGTGAALIDQVIPGARPTGQTICEWLEDMDAVRALLAAGD